MKKEFIWGGVHVYVDKGKIVKIEDEGDMYGNKTFKKIEVNGNNLHLESLSGVIIDYNIDTKQLRISSPFKFEGKINDFMKVSYIVDTVPYFEQFLSREFGRVSIKMNFYNPIDSLYVGDEIESVNDIESLSDKEFIYFIDDLLYRTDECEESIGSIRLKNLSSEDKHIIIEIDKPEDLIIVSLDNDRTYNVYTKPLEVTLKPEETKKIKLLFISPVSGKWGEVKITVIDKDKNEEIVSKKYGVYMSC